MVESSIGNPIVHIRKPKQCVICDQIVLPFTKRKELCGDVSYFCEDCDPFDFTCGVTNSCR